MGGSYVALKGVTMMKKYELFDNIKSGQKITIVSQNSFGFVNIIQTMFVESEPHNHYQNCPDNMIGVKILHRPRRKRNNCYTVIDYNADIIIYDGWQDISTDCLYNAERRSEGVEIRKSKYLSFDVRNFEEIRRNYPDNILADSLGSARKD